MKTRDQSFQAGSATALLLCILAAIGVFGTAVLIFVLVGEGHSLVSTSGDVAEHSTIQLLDRHQGAVMAALTVGLLLANFWLALLGQRQAKISQSALDSNLAAEEAKYRPYVIFDIVYEQVVAYARIRNSGISPALEIRVTVEPRLYWDDNNQMGIGFIENGVSYLAPTRELSQPFGWTNTFFAQYPKLTFVGNVTYKDQRGNSYDEAFLIDLGYIRSMSYIGKKDVAQELEQIRKALERMTSSSYQPLIRTITEEQYQTQQEEHIKDVRARSAAIKATQAVKQSESPAQPQAEK